MQLAEHTGLKARDSGLGHMLAEVARQGDILYIGQAVM